MTGPISFRPIMPPTSPAVNTGAVTRAPAPSAPASPTPAAVPARGHSLPTGSRPIDVQSEASRVNASIAQANPSQIQARASQFSQMGLVPSGFPRLSPETLQQARQNLRPVSQHQVLNLGAVDSGSTTQESARSRKLGSEVGGVPLDRDRLPGAQGALDIVGHSSENGMKIEGRSPQQLASLLKHQYGLQQINTIHLVSCKSEAFKAEFQQALSEVGVEVGEITAPQGQVAVDRTTGKALDETVVGDLSKLDGHDGELGLSPMAGLCMHRIQNAYHSGSHVKIQETLEAVSETLGDMPDGTGKAATAQLGKALTQFFGTRDVTHQLRSILGRSGMQSLAQTLPYPDGTSARAYAPVDLSNVKVNKIQPLITEAYNMIMDGYNSGKTDYFSKSIENAAETLGDMPDGTGKAATAQLGKALTQFFGTRDVTHQLRSILGRSGVQSLAQTLPYPDGTSARAYAPVDLAHIELSDMDPGLMSAKEKDSNAKALIEDFDEVVFYVGNTPNYGMQSQTTRMIQYVRDNLAVDKPLNIATPCDIHPWEQTVSMNIEVPENANFDLDTFLQKFASGEKNELTKGTSTDFAVDRDTITLGKGVTGHPTNAYELQEYIKKGFPAATNQGIDLDQIRVLKGPGDTPDEDMTIARPSNGSGMKTISVSFKMEQPEVITTEDKILHLAPELKDHPKIKFIDIADLGKSGAKTLMLSGPLDDPLEARDTNGNSKVTQVHIPDKDHHPENRRIFLQGKSYGFPDSIEKGALFPSKIDPNAIENSTLGNQEQANLNALLQQNTDLLYTYGFHQVPSESREDLLKGMLEGAQGTGAKRPVVFVVGDKDIPDTDYSDKLDLNSANFIEALSKETDRPLLIMAGRLPTDVNDLIMSKSSLVLAEGKGSISKCQELGVKHLILPQSGTETPLVLKTEYHDKSSDFGLKQASLDLYRNPKAIIQSYLFQNHEELYDGMSSSQNLLTETLSMFKHSLGHFKELA